MQLIVIGAAAGGEEAETTAAGGRSGWGLQGWGCSCRGSGGAAAGGDLQKLINFTELIFVVLILVQEVYPCRAAGRGNYWVNYQATLQSRAVT